MFYLDFTYRMLKFLCHDAFVFCNQWFEGNIGM
jgi:hypothetical protein